MWGEQSRRRSGSRPRRPTARGRRGRGMAVSVELLELRAGDLVQSIAEKVWAFPHLKRGDLLRIVAVDADGIVSYEMAAPYLRHADCLETFTPTAAVKWM